jgi:aspartate aminotransferase
VKIIIRLSYSNPPCHPARIAGRILDDPVKRDRWLAELKVMADRIINMRAYFIII